MGKGFGRHYLHEVPLLTFNHDSLDEFEVNPTGPTPDTSDSGLGVFSKKRITDDKLETIAIRH
jgi:hypothetical protein